MIITELSISQQHINIQYYHHDIIVDHHIYIITIAIFISFILGLTKTNRILLWPILSSFPLDSNTLHYNTDVNDSSNAIYKVT